VPGTFAEIGCGAGRITKQLAAAFERGHAFDVSEDMIHYAGSRINAGNVEWHVTDGLALDLQDNSIDAVFSCHVFQHLASTAAGYEYFSEIHRVLRPGGSLMIHLPVHMFPAAVSRKFAGLCDVLYGRVEWFLDKQSASRRLRMRKGGVPPMHGVSYAQPELHRKLREIGFDRVELATFPIATSDILHTFVLASKRKDLTVRV
jgi:ubiquinone/menaquinone biosynthesis C-methylase UbiE